MVKQNVVYPYLGIRMNYGHGARWMELKEIIVNFKKSQKVLHIVKFHLYNIFAMIKL